MKNKRQRIYNFENKNIKFLCLILIIISLIFFFQYSKSPPNNPHYSSSDKILNGIFQFNTNEDDIIQDYSTISGLGISDNLKMETSIQSCSIRIIQKPTVKMYKPYTQKCFGSDKTSLFSTECFQTQPDLGYRYSNRHVIDTSNGLVKSSVIKKNSNILFYVFDFQSSLIGNSMKYGCDLNVKITQNGIKKECNLTYIDGEINFDEKCSGCSIFNKSSIDHTSIQLSQLENVFLERIKGNKHNLTDFIDIQSSNWLKSSLFYKFEKLKGQTDFEDIFNEGMKDRKNIQQILIENGNQIHKTDIILQDDDPDQTKNYLNMMIYLTRRSILTLNYRIENVN